MDNKIYHIYDKVFKKILTLSSYGYNHANRIHIQEDGIYHLCFPEARIIYLYNETDIPDKSILRLDFGEQGFFDYKVIDFKFLQNSTEELNKKKMIILIPFALLRLRKAIEKKRSPENLLALQKLIQDLEVSLKIYE